MQKPKRLRETLMSRLPELANEPDRLVIWVEQGAIKARQTESHSFSFSYTLSILLVEVATDVAIIAHAINRWLRIEQSDLLTGGSGDSYAFEADILDNGASDVSITLALSEEVAIAENEDGSWSVDYQAEPDPLFTDREPGGDNDSAPPLAAATSVEDIVAD